MLTSMSLLEYCVTILWNWQTIVCTSCLHSNPRGCVYFGGTETLLYLRGYKLMSPNIHDIYNPFVRQNKKIYVIAGLPEKKGSQNIRTQTLYSPDNCWEGTHPKAPSEQRTALTHISGIMKQKKALDCHFLWDCACICVWVISSVCVGAASLLRA